MNILDILIIILLVPFIYIGLKKGFISELIQIAAFATAFLISSPIGKWLGAILANSFQIDKDLLFCVTGITAFAVIYSLSMIIGSILTPVPASGTVLSFGNKISGGILGAVKGFMIATVFVLLLRVTPFSSFITDNVDYSEPVEKDIYELSTLKSTIIAVKDQAIFLASDSANKEINLDAIKDSVFKPEIDTTSLSKIEVKPKTKAKLGYLAYKLSTAMDPTVNGYKKYVFSKIDKSLENITQSAKIDSISAQIKK